MICPRCKTPMKIQNSDRTFHKSKKFKCSSCGLVRFQKIKKVKNKY